MSMFDHLHSSHIKPTSEYLKKVLIRDGLLSFDDIVHPVAPWCQADFRSFLLFSFCLMKLVVKSPSNSH